MNMGTNVRLRLGTGPGGGFTRTEALVLVVVVLILGSLAVAFFALSRKGDEARKCLANLRQVGFGYLNYLKDYDFWMPCAGNRDGEHYSSQDVPRKGAPTYEVPWFYWHGPTQGFPYWYETFQPYVDASATAAAARKSYKDRTGKEVDPSNSQPALRVEQARLMGIFACPSKPGAPVGYGYNYTAPFGNTYCYPNNRDTFMWNDTNGKQYASPVSYSGKTVPTCILWYQQSMHSSVLTKKSTQTLVCDTGLSTPETRDMLDSRLWRETADNNDEGYVRFPLMKGYWPPENKVPVYRLRPWRPMPRHDGKTACLFGDGSARAVPIQELCSPDIQWGDARCLFDNEPPNRPPGPPIFGGSED